MAKNRGVSDAVLKVRAEQPDLQYKQIAAIVGCSEATVQTICHRAGVGRRPVKNRKWERLVRDAREMHPGWSVNRIARELGANKSTVHRIVARCFPGSVTVVKLGRAAMRAGLTLKQIEGMSR